jgi:cyclophilin family peptidyl-prolyl cis-trans isomerase
MKTSSVAHICLLSCLLFICSCAAKKPSSNIVIITNYGDIEIELYDQTPQHRDNFIKLVQEGYYDGTLFHRVIKNFMIQGGDPDTKNAKPGVRLGNGGPEYTIPAEFVPGYIHRRGALAAARQSENVNPEMASSGSQFYIVWGEIFTDEQLGMVEAGLASKRDQSVFAQYMKEVTDSIKGAGTAVDMAQVQTVAAKKTAAYQSRHPFKMKEEDRQVYKTAGGTPHLDGTYTVFGQVTKGLEVVEKISNAATDNAARPKADIKVKKMVFK